MSINHDASSPADAEEPLAGAPPTAEMQPDPGRDDPRTQAGIWFDRIIDWFIDSWPDLLVGAATFTYFYYYAQLTIEVHQGYGTSAFDIGIFDQGVWKLSRFQVPEVTITGRNLFADHSSFILFLVAPIYWIAPGPETLLWIQALVLALPAIPIYWVAKKRIGAPLASILAVAYLLHPALGASNMENYHPDSFSALFVALALYAAIENRRVMFIVMCVLLLSVKEDAILVVLPLALWFAWRRDWKLGSIMAAVSFASTLFAFKVIRTFTEGLDLQSNLRVPFGGYRGSLETFYRRPGEVIDYVRSDGRPWYLWQMLFPTAFVFLISPEIAAISSLVLVWNVMSTFGYQHLIGYHYVQVVIPILGMGTVWAVAMLKTQRRRVIAVAAVAVCSLWACYLWGPQSWSRNKEFGHWGPKNPTVVQIEEIRRQVPSGAVVSAYHSFVPHVGHRDRIYMWPVPWRAAYWGLLNQEGERLSFTNDIEYLFLPTTLNEDDQKLFDTFKDQFEVVASNSAATLYKRVRPG